MIKRYSNLEMESIWTDESKFDAFLKVEIAAARAWSKLGHIPIGDVDTIATNAKIDVERIAELEKTLRHDVIAFTRQVSETLGEEKKWVHYGMTSTDVVDTAYAVQLQRTNKIIIEDINNFIDVLAKQAKKYINVPTIGRTHGIHADITSFGLKWALWYDEMQRNLERFQKAASDIEIGKISGAVGNFANISPEVQDITCELLGIKSAKISTQVLQRDRHAAYMQSIALIGSTIEKIAIEIRHLQRTEVREVFEYFDKNQKGSSAMPHKKNPISSENVSGIARVLRGYMVTSMENMALWHERDISHSSAERIIIPDATILIDYILKRYTKVLDNVIVDEKRMMKNIWSTNGVIFSQRLLTNLIDEGMSREEAYDTVQPVAINSFENELNFREEILKNENIVKLLGKDKINFIFDDMEYFMKESKTILKRVGITK